MYVKILKNSFLDSYKFAEEKIEIKQKNKKKDSGKKVEG